MQINKCRCGAKPKIVTKDIAGPTTAWAIHCEKFCGDDSHWQMNLIEAIERWNAGLVRGASGGNGAASDDLQQHLT